MNYKLGPTARWVRSRMDWNAANRAELRQLIRAFRAGHQPERAYTVPGRRMTWIRVSLADAGHFLFLAK